MKIYIKNMVCQGTKSFVINELRKLGFRYNRFESGELHLTKDLSLSEIKKLDNSFKKFGLEYTFVTQNLPRQSPY